MMKMENECECDNKIYTNLKGYRLGDMFGNLTERNKKDGKAFHIKSFPESIAAKYLQKTNDIANYDILKEIVYNKFIPDKNINKNNNCLLHLRVGDVIDKVCPGKYFFNKFYKNIDTGKKGDKIVCYYIQPLEYFKKYIKILHSINIKKVYIIAGSHFKLPSYKYSKHYINKVVRVLEQNGFFVELRLGISR